MVLGVCLHAREDASNGLGQIVEIFFSYVNTSMLMHGISHTYHMRKENYLKNLYLNRVRLFARLCYTIRVHKHLSILNLQAEYHYFYKDT